MNNEKIDVSAKEFFKKLLEEVNPEKVIWKTTKGDLTAKEIISDLQNNGELSKSYISELMRISRDFLSRKNKP